MVYPASRSMNADFNEGATDSKYKKVVQDRGLAEPGTYELRRDLDDAWHGIHEAASKNVPGRNQSARTPNFVQTPTAEEDF